MINWDIRYAKAVAMLPELADATLTILEVGAGGGGLRRYCPRNIIGVELDFSLATGARPWGVVARAGRLPFPDRSVDVVLAMDLLEHLSPEERKHSLAEMARVSRGRVLVGGPLGAFAAWGDARYHDFLCQRGQAVPRWLAEHLSRGIPSVAEILHILDDLALDYRIHVNETLIQHYAGVLADEVPFLAQVNATFRNKRPDISPLGADERDVPYSYLVDIRARKSVPAAPANPSPAAPLGAPRSVSIYFPAQLRHPSMQSIAHHIPFPAASAAPIGLAAGGTLAAIHAVWRKEHCGSHVGFCHPNRFFDFSSPTGGRRTTLLANDADLRRHLPSITAIEQYSDALAGNTVLVAMTEPARPTVAERYMHDHFAGHYLAAINLLLEDCPHLRPYIRQQFSDDRLFGGSMFICRVDFFHQLCHWLFPLLERTRLWLGIAARHDIPLLDSLLERMLSLYFSWKFDTGTERAELSLFAVDGTAFPKNLHP